MQILCPDGASPCCSGGGGGSGSVPESRNIFTTAPLQGGGNLSSNLTILLDYNTNDFVLNGTTLELNPESNSLQWLNRLLLAKVR